MKNRRIIKSGFLAEHRYISQHEAGKLDKARLPKQVQYIEQAVG
jgi:hypothetical protein